MRFLEIEVVNTNKIYLRGPQSENSCFLGTKFLSLYVNFHSHTSKEINDLSEMQNGNLLGNLVRR